MAYTTIDDPTSFFNTVLYTGNATDNRTVTGVGFQPNWSWLKDRTNGNHHRIYDSVRGATKAIYSSLTTAEGTASDGLKSFDSDGFTLGTGSDENGNSANFVSWNWLAGGSASSNSDGDITSSVSVNTTAGFSIVSYTGTGSNATVGHGLGVAPKMVIIKHRSDTYDWVVYHKDAGNTGFLRLNTTNATDTGINMFQNTDPTSSVFSISTHGAVNDSSDNFIAYCFAEKQGYSKIGSYTGGSDPFVYLGFKPAWIMFKNSSASENWRIIDNKRDTDNPAAQHLYPNLANAEGSGTSYNDFIDFLSNGFKIRSGSGEIDGSGNTIIFMAFAESPFVNSNGIPNNSR